MIFQESGPGSELAEVSSGLVDGEGAGEVVVGSREAVLGMDAGEDPIVPAELEAPKGTEVVRVKDIVPVLVITLVAEVGVCCACAVLVIVSVRSSSNVLVRKPKGSRGFAPPSCWRGSLVFVWKCGTEVR